MKLKTSQQVTLPPYEGHRIVAREAFPETRDS